MGDIVGSPYDRFRWQKDTTNRRAKGQRAGDSDTLACITGGIAEAFYGMPQELRDETLKRLPEDIREGYELLCFMIAKMI